MNILVVGRFQPLHHGHAALLQHASSLGDVTVVIGSSQANDLDNPFPAAVRQEMVRIILPDARVIAVCDINDPENYAAHVLQATGPMDAIVGHDKRTLDLFTSLRRIQLPLQQRNAWQGAVIRTQLRSGEAWQDAVPTALHGLVVKYFPV